MIRTGIGYDIHQLVPGRRLILAGVEIPYERGLAGHSDADVVLHAIADALLGAAGLGDIGVHFPPSDPQWRDADSRDLLRRVGAMLAPDWTIVNIDASVIAEAPKIGPYREAMRAAVAAALDLDPRRVNIKGTTNEQLGAVGRGEGIAALAIALVAAREREDGERAAE